VRTPAPPAQFVAETHLSVLLFEGEVVLKFKKPLRFPFVDFTSIAARLAACEEEVRSNRRLSPDVYLGVADIRLGHVAGPGSHIPGVLDHAVVMRRLPASRALSALVRSAHPDVPPGLASLASLLARFHAEAARGPDIDDAARPAALTRTWQRCLWTLDGYRHILGDPDALEEVRSLALEYLCGRHALLEQRIAAGRVCDGHGDLLADDVFLLEDGPRVLDCIEFDPTLRHVDVAADVAFLAMDLERLGASAPAADFSLAYQVAADDHFPPTLFDHYVAARAVVRAEVACLRGPAPDGAEAGRLLSLARAHLRRGRVVLVVVNGLPGTGKSTLAQAVSERLGWPVLRSDEIRRDLVAPQWQGPLVAAVFPDAYSPPVTEATYAALVERARAALALGQPVIVDATFGDRRVRQAVESLAEQAAAPLAVFTCQAPASVTTRRLRHRSESGAGLSGADQAVAEMLAAAGAGQPWPGAVVLDTSRPTAELVEEVLRTLEQLPCAQSLVRAGGAEQSGGR
jgi:aminoglycoside phosphotransferase family enzyme/predicted kinase